MMGSDRPPQRVWSAALGAHIIEVKLPTAHIEQAEFQRRKEGAIRMLTAMMDIYAPPAASAGPC
jgi:hypothetical protein